MNTRTHTLPAGSLEKATKGHAFFDPQDVVAEHLTDYPRLLAPVTDSMAWMLDQLCINAATTIMFDLYKAREDEDRAVNLIDYSGVIVDILDRDEVYAGTKDEHRVCEIESTENTLAMLLGLRTKWHDIAYKAAAENDTDYDVDGSKTKFSLKLANQAAREIEPEEMELIRHDIRKVAKSDEQFERMLKNHLDTLKLQAEQSAADAKKLIPLKMEILRAVGKHRKTDIRFDQLPLRTQRTLVNFTIGAIERPKARLRKVMAKREAIAYTLMSDAAYEAQAELERAMVSKYAGADELENASSTKGHDELDKARRAKAFDAALID